MIEPVNLCYRCYLFTESIGSKTEVGNVSLHSNSIKNEFFEELAT